MIVTTFHKSFRLNGIAFNSVEELLKYVKTLDGEYILSFLEHWFAPNNFIEVQTSGSTGTPKMIRIKKEHMKNSAMTTGTFFNLFDETKALLCLSTAYIAGKMMLVRALTLGWNLDIVTPSSNPLKNIDKEYDFCAMVPLQLSNSLDQLYKVNTVIVGGGSVSNELISQLQDLNTMVYATYGMTETITQIALKKLNQNVKNTVTHYKVLPTIKITKDNRGCLVIEAPNITGEKVITNDLVEIISENEFEWLGRYDHIINSGGVKLIPEQIEAKLSKVLNERFFVAGVPDNVLGKKLILIIESENEDSMIFDKINNLKTLTKYEKPKTVYYLINFVETETKKIQRSKTLDLIFK